tara:strand:+ start:766 stop:1902 length:1137 start_codon:yes stop_codon:yes gene_type:complete
MAVPGTGSTNQSMTLSAFKKLAGKANTSALREFYEETIPSNVQIKTDTIFAQSIPQNVTTSTLYSRFSSSASDPATVEYVEFYAQAVDGTTYEADIGTFGDVGFGGGDESQGSGPHAYQLRLTSSYETLSSYSGKSSGFFVNDQIVHASNGGLQLVHPSFGPQSGNNYGLELYTGHPDYGGTRIFPTDPIDWQVDYFNGIVFIQDFRDDKRPAYARGFIYIGKFANTLITEASSSGGGAAITIKDEGSNLTTAVASIDFVGSGVTATKPSGENITVTIPGGISYSRRAVTSTITASVNDRILGVSGSTAIDIRLPSAADYSAGQFFTIKDESGASDTKNITIKPSGSQTIDGSTFIILESPHAAVNIYSDGTSKFFIY